MSATGNTWAILVATKPALSSAGALGGPEAETNQLMARATAVAFPPRTCVIIAEEFEQHWRHLATRLTPSNVFSSPPGIPIIDAVMRCLTDVTARDPGANCVLIPADHCAPVESAWILSANSAVQLGSAQSDTVYILHDKPQNDPRTSRKYPGLCSSSVMVGSADSLLDLCLGARPAKIIDILVGDSADNDNQSVQLTNSAETKPLRVVHITSVEEYASLQRGEYGRRQAIVDLHA